MRWAILKTSTWMLASPNDDGGTLANGQSITINLSASAAFLPHFTYTGTVEVNGYDATTQNTLGSFSIPVNLTVN